MPNHVAQSALVHELRHALAFLYDPVALARSPLVRLLGLAGQDDTTSALRRILTEGIEALRPDLSVPAHTKPWRCYHTLRHHYIEQFTQREVARDFNISIRQLRRLERDALQLLSESLVRRYGIVAPERAGAEADAEAGAIPPVNHAGPSRSQEVEWSQRSFPSGRVTLASLIEGTVRVIEPLLASLHIRFEASLPETMPLLAVQPDIVRQALLNIIAASAHAIPGGRLALCAVVQPRTVTLQIIATGLSAVHAPFTDDHVEGSRVTRQLLESTGGRMEPVRVDSAETFTVEIALPAEDLITFLVIDDNPDTLQLLERYTANTRYRFLGIQDATKAVNTAETILPDIIVLDVMLPNTDGWELLGQLRAHPQTSAIPVVICTIMPQEQLALTLGAGGFIRKPVSRSDFLAVLDAQVRLLGR
jgi:CheY-like chemotaxis protein